MLNETEVGAWIERYGPLMSAVGEPRQRHALFASFVDETDPDLAPLVLEHILAKNFTSKTGLFKIYADAAVSILVGDGWNPDLRARSIEGATAFGAALALTYLKYATYDEAEVDRASNRPLQYLGTDRPLTLGERRFAASRPTRFWIEKAMTDPHPMVITRLLTNPQLTESDVLVMATKRPGRVRPLSEIALHPRWHRRRHVAKALVLNPATPIGLALALLIVFPRRDMQEVAADQHLDETVRHTAGLFLQARP